VSEAPNRQLTSYRVLKKREVHMAESDISKNAVTKRHGKHHRTHIPKAHPDDGPSKNRHAKTTKKVIARNKDERKEGNL
jgi:hypothetical protein